MSTRQRLENGLFFLGYLVRDIAKQQRMEWQHLFALKASTKPDDAPSTPKSSQHFGERQRMEKTINLFSVFDSNDGALYASSNPMATSCSTVSMATLCLELGNSLPRSISLSFAVGFGAWDAAEEL